jgi:hypothetical protein
MPGSCFRTSNQIGPDQKINPEISNGAEAM